MSKFIKRRERGNASAKALATADLETADATFAKKYPALAEFLALEQWDQETPRQRGTLTLFFEDGAFKASVNDRDSESVAFVTKGSFQALLESVEKGLAQSTLDWRGWSKKGKQGARKG